jgi:phosphate transport system permease protein
MNQAAEAPGTSGSLENDGAGKEGKGQMRPTPSFINLTEKSIASRLRKDAMARHAVTFGGMAVICSILAILFVIAAEVYPLLKKPFSRHPLTFGLPKDAGEPLATAVDEYREMAVVFTTSGSVVADMKKGVIIKRVPIPGVGGASLVSASPSGKDSFILGLADGRAVTVRAKFNVSYSETGQRVVSPEVDTGEPEVIDGSGSPLDLIHSVEGERGLVVVAAVGSKELSLLTVKKSKSLVDDGKTHTVTSRLSIPIEGEISALELDSRGEEALAGTSKGEVVRLNINDDGSLRIEEMVKVGSSQNAKITILGFLLGDRTLVVGDSTGGVSSWQIVKDKSNQLRLAKIHDFTPHAKAVTAFSPSLRNKAFATADESGEIAIRYGTSGETLLYADSVNSPVVTLTMTPKSDGVVAVDKKGSAHHMELVNPHPEVTLSSLFGKVWYEGYEKPEYVWQSTGGSDDFEPKLSLVPMIFGTLKGTLYAMLFAIPISLLAALYTSQFMHPSVRSFVKPTVEVMAALPSVVLGFIAGLWLAPIMEKVTPGFFILPLVAVVVILSTAFAWKTLAPLRLRSRVTAGMEIVVLVPALIAAGYISFKLGGWLEGAFLGGDYRQWIKDAMGLTYDQRNSLVVGLVMGFAVIPIIFTITEDSLANVPPHLRAGSLALGATAWQTAMRVILPAASPGIFSAIMIGFGRAVGETMIVLMATGNTPVMDWSVFNGFRALSANIAVELPEAPEQGSLYRVLFLAALLLFMMTFAVNTVAEIVRLRLRKRYSE